MAVNTRKTVSFFGTTISHLLFREAADVRASQRVEFDYPARAVVNYEFRRLRSQRFPTISKCRSGARVVQIQTPLLILTTNPVKGPCISCTDGDKIPRCGKQGPIIAARTKGAILWVT